MSESVNVNVVAVREENALAWAAGYWAGEQARLGGACVAAVPARYSRTEAEWESYLCGFWAGAWAEVAESAE